MKASGNFRCFFLLIPQITHIFTDNAQSAKAARDDYSKSKYYFQKNA